MKIAGLYIDEECVMDYEDIVEDFRVELDQLEINDDTVSMMNHIEAQMLVATLTLQRRLNQLEKDLTTRIALGL